MKALAVCFGIALAIVLTVALAPVSGWVFKNQLDLAQKQKPIKPFLTDFQGYICPDWVTDPNTYRGSDFSEEAYHALLLRDMDKTEKELERLAKSHPNEPLAWVLLARSNCIFGARMPDESFLRKTETPEKKRQSIDAAKMGREACLRGEALEPKNCYFTQLKASFDASLGLSAEMKQALREAASQSEYNNHVNDLYLLLQRAEFLEKGYRGEFLKDYVGINLLLEEDGAISELGRFLNRNGDLQEKRDLVQSLWLITKGADLSYEMIQAARLVKVEIEPPVPLFASTTLRTDSEWRQLAKGFDNKLVAAHISLPRPNTLDIYLGEQKVFDALKKYSKTYYSGPHQAAFWEALRPLEALLALACSILMGGLALCFQRIKADLFRRMLPHLVSLPLWLEFLALASSDDQRYGQPHGAMLLQAGFLLALLQVSISFLYMRKRWAVLGTALVALVSLATILYSFVFGLFVLGTSAGLSEITLIASLELVALAWFLSIDKRQRLAPYLGWIVVFLAVLISFLPPPLSDSSALFGAVGFAITPLLTWRTKCGNAAKPAQWITVALFILVSGGAGAFAAWEKVTNINFHGVYYLAGFLVLFISMLFVGKPVRNVAVGCCISWILFSGIYLATVGIQVRGNHQMAMAGQLREGDAIRKLAGI